MANDNNVYTYDVNFSVGECPTLQTTAPDFILPNGTPAGAISCCPPVGPDGRWLCPGTLGAFVISWPARKNNRNIKYIFQVIGITFDDMSLSNVTLPRAASTSNCLCNSWHRFSITAFCGCSSNFWQTANVWSTACWCPVNSVFCVFMFFSPRTGQICVNLGLVSQNGQMVLYLIHCSSMSISKL